MCQVQGAAWDVSAVFSIPSCFWSTTTHQPKADMLNLPPMLPERRIGLHHEVGCCVRRRHCSPSVHQFNVIGIDWLTRLIVWWTCDSIDSESFQNFQNEDSESLLLSEWFWKFSNFQNDSGSFQNFQNDSGSFQNFQNRFFSESAYRWSFDAFNRKQNTLGSIIY